MLANKLQTSERDIVYRTRGHKRGPIARLVSPSDLGEAIKPLARGRVNRVQQSMHI